MTTLADQPARERIRTDLTSTLMVEAAAGTGKTAELIRRMIALLKSGTANVNGIVAVTFTEKAAGELKLRLRIELEFARRSTTPGTAAHAHLTEAVTHLEEATINTIHGFCSELLRERPIEAGIDPSFSVLTEPEAQRLFTRTFHSWLQYQLNNPPAGLHRSLCRTGGRNDEGPSDRLCTAAWQLCQWRDHPAPWRRDPFDRTKEIDALLAQIQEVAHLSGRSGNRNDSLYLSTAGVRQLADHVNRFQGIRQRDDDELEGALIGLLTDDFKSDWTGFGEFYAKNLRRETVIDARDQLRATVERFEQAASADLAAVLHAELQDVLHDYARAKEHTGALDFLDLLLHTRNLLLSAPSVRRAFQERYTHLFVDEFQDTDPLQAEILLLLAANDPANNDWRTTQPMPGKLFLVGDPKQAIYRFRRADVGIYEEVKQLLQNTGAGIVQLTTSFRSRPAIQHAVNAAFGPVMRHDPTTLQTDYVPLSPYRTEKPEQPSIVALPVPKPYSKKRGVTKTAIDKSLPSAVAAFVQWLLKESHWTIEEHGQQVPITARHICLLFRNFESFYTGDITRGYAHAFEDRNIPHLIVGGRSFHIREEVSTLRTALCAIEWPDDDVAVFATLKGSLFAISDTLLLQYRQRYGRLHPFQQTHDDAPAPLQPICETLTLLAELHRARNYRTVADTIARLLEATRAAAAFVMRPSGEQILANVQQVAELANAFEQSAGLSFRDFISQLPAVNERGNTPEALIFEEDSDGVRMMTTYKAKGLEFPVVILADMATASGRKASRFVDATARLAAVRIGPWAPQELLENIDQETERDGAEAVRIAYVAATRARDLLVIPAVGDEPFQKGWFRWLNASIYPTRGRQRDATPGPGCPAFGSDTVLDRNTNPTPEAGNVRPGLHTFTNPDYGVTWWDPALLKLDVPRHFGIRQDELLGKDTAPAIIEADLARYRTWEQARTATLAIGAQPSISVSTATRHAFTGAYSQAEVLTLVRDDQRPGGLRFGALVHAILATVSLRAQRDTIEQAASLQARILGATDEEAIAAVEAVLVALNHPLMARAAAADDRGDCRREVPVTLQGDEHTIVEGVVDLAFREEETWVVVEYKTDHDADTDRYQRQLATYAEAIRISTNAPVTPILLVI